MLSKVIRGDGVGSIQAMVFPAVTDRRQDTSVHAPAGFGSRPPADSDALHARCEELEARIASERRNAFEEGRRDAEQRAAAELKPVLERLAASTAEVLSMRADLRQRAEADVVHLALSIAKRILHRQLDVDEAALAALARVALERLRRAENYRVSVHPRFASAIQAALPPAQSSQVRVEADPACAPGTLIIHCPDGTIDASIDSQLDEIGRGLCDRLGLS
jgi:flagellar assembly protein FliH